MMTPWVISPVPSVITSGCTRSTATPTPLINPTTSPSASPTAADHASPIRNVIVVIRNAAPVATLTTDRSMPAGQHHQGLAGRENAERRGEQQRVRQPDRIDGAGLGDFDADNEAEQQEDQHDDRVALQPEQHAARSRQRRDRATP